MPIDRALPVRLALAVDLILIIRDTVKPMRTVVSKQGENNREKPAWLGMPASLLQMMAAMVLVFHNRSDGELESLLRLGIHRQILRIYMDEAVPDKNHPAEIEGQHRGIIRVDGKKLCEVRIRFATADLPEDIGTDEPLDDVDAMNEFMETVSDRVFSSFDTEKQPGKSEPERFYHGFVLGLMVDMSEDYVVRSNRESGFGRYDVMIYSKDLRSKGIIIEFKVHKPLREKSLEETVENALRQIEEKNYEAELKSLGFAEENIRKYGFAFEGKKVLIGKGECAER